MLDHTFFDIYRRPSENFRRMRDIVDNGRPVTELNRFLEGLSDEEFHALAVEIQQHEHNERVVQMFLANIHFSPS